MVFFDVDVSCGVVDGDGEAFIPVVLVDRCDGCFEVHTVMLRPVR